ncbi:MAG: hypothetical protein JWO82_971, partial [Akkermansiaceae bacterium]|nr:hypothetical protein [Akkermansiaceae bacterium]
MPLFLRLLPACLLLATPADGVPFTSPRLEAVTSWVGNTYGGGTKWVQQDIHALTVTADGTVFTNVPWDEAGGNAGEYRDGELVRHALHTHGWGYEGGEAVACNSRYVFIAGEVANEGGGLKSPDSWPPKGCRWIGVSRRLRQDLSQPAPFDGGKGGQGDTLKSAFLVTGEMPDTSKEHIPGLCADEQRLYVADPLANRIRIYSTESMRELSAWPVERTGPLAIDPHGLIWLLQRKTADSPARLLRYDADGKPQGQPLTLDPAIVPAAFCLAGDGRVLIADDSPAQQVRIFSVAAEALKEEGRFGEPGGIFSGTPGAFGERKFNHLSALGCDAQDNLYVAHDGQSGGGGTVLES